jgi:phosphonate transport system ATP-binding protein
MRYPNGKTALTDVSINVDAGELVTILGSNGSGKSTLLRCIARLLDPAGGEIWVDNRDLSNLSGDELRLARRGLAMIFQNPNLVKRRSVLANVVSGSLGYHGGLRTSLGMLPRSEIPKAQGYLDAVGLRHLAEQRAGTLSGGQAQRVAISRALAQRPKVLLADEPVSALDPQATEEIMALLRHLAREEGLAVLCVLHQPQLALRYSHRIIGLQDGQVIFDLPSEQLDDREVTTLYGGMAA